MSARQILSLFFLGNYIKKEKRTIMRKDNVHRINKSRNAYNDIVERYTS